MRSAISLLMGLGVAAQILLSRGLRDDLKAVIRDEADESSPFGLLLAAPPILPASGGSAMALPL